MLGILPLFLVLIRGDFPICQAVNNQDNPFVLFANNQYYVFWRDYRENPTRAGVYGARVLIDGTVLDPDSRLIYYDDVATPVRAAYDGTNFLVVLRDSC